MKKPSYKHFEKGLTLAGNQHTNIHRQSKSIESSQTIVSIIICEHHICKRWHWFYIKAQAKIRLVLLQALQKAKRAVPSSDW